MAIDQDYTQEGGVWAGAYGAWIWRDAHDNNQLHRVDGPAVIRPDGRQYWLLHGQYHRVGGPAVIYSDGGQYWYQHGVLHRVDGPAVIREGHHEWCVQGREITAEVEAWLRDNTITWPFTAEQQMEFCLRWL
jgi:hypothetical protein